MAARFLAKGFVSNLSKAIPPPPLLRRELSRVCFCSASNQTLDTSQEQDKGDSRADFAYQDKDWRKEAGCNGKEAKKRAEDGFRETMDKTSDQAEEVKLKAKEGASRAFETGESAKEKTKEMGVSMADKAEETKTKVKEGAHDVKDSAGEAAETMTEKAKKTVKEAWGAAKEKSQQVKESVMGSEEEDEREKAMDEDVVELRRKAGKED